MGVPGAKGSSLSGDIELEIGAADGEPGVFKVRVLHSVGGGQPWGRLVLDAEGILGRRDDLERAVLSSAVQRRGAVSAAERPVREVGQQLFEALFTGQVYGAYRASLGAVQQSGKRLRVVIRLTAPELAALPWEAMFDPETGAYLCRTEPLVRRVDAPYTPDPLVVHPPLQILGLVAAPRGLPSLDADAEQLNLEKALAKPLAAGLVKLTWAPDASWETIHDLMLDGTWHILHFIGHGFYDNVNNEGLLALAGPSGRTDLVEASRLADLLSEAEPTPPLVVLNSCSSGESGAHDLFSGTAAALVRRGISAVAAMQFGISDDAAIKFARGFYAAIARGRSVDEAIRSGRIEILGTARTLEWITPVLYVRGGATQLFSFAGPVTAAPPVPPAEAPRTVPPSNLPAVQAMYSKARAEMRMQHFDAAIDLLGELLALRPDHSEAAELLEQAHYGKQLADAYARARIAGDAGEWSTAISEYDGILRSDPSFRDARGRREDCNKKQQIADRLAALRYHYDAENWPAVVAVDAELASLDPAAADPGGMATKARAELRRARAVLRRADVRQHQAPARSTSGTKSQDVTTSPVLLDKIVMVEAVAVGSTAYALHSPRSGVVELVRLDLARGEPTTRANIPGGFLVAASPGGVVVTDQQIVITYDPELRLTGRWKAGEGWLVRELAVTRRCGWGLVTGPPTEVSARMSKGTQFNTRLVRIDFATGMSKVYSLGTDTYWRDPPEFRGLQLMSTGGNGDAEVVALRCEWFVKSVAVTKRKIAVFAREDTDDIRSYPAGATNWTAPGPDPRQLLRWNDLTLLGFTAVGSARSRVALARGDGHLESPALLREFGGQPVYWVFDPAGPVVLAPAGGEPEKTDVWRLVRDGSELRYCSTLPGGFRVKARSLFDSARDKQISAAVESDRLWWGVTNPSGLACLSADNAVTRIDHRGDPIVLGAGNGRVHVLVDSETGGLELRTIQVR